MENNYKVLFDAVKRVIDSWDPMALLKNGAPGDEYGSEVAQVVARIKEIRSEVDAALVLSEVMNMAFDTKVFTSDSCAETGKSIFEKIEGDK